MAFLHSKVIILGDSGCGKTSLLRNYLGFPFLLNGQCTIGVEYGAKNIKIADLIDPNQLPKKLKKNLPKDIENSMIKLSYWDTAGQERFHSVITSYYRGVNAIIFVCDLTRRNTFDHLDYWIADFQKTSNVILKDTVAIIIGNKADLKEQIHVYDEDLKKLSEKHDMPYFIVSAKEDVKKIPEIFQLLGQLVFKKYLENPDPENKDYSPIDYLNFQNIYSSPSSKCCT